MHALKWTWAELSANAVSCNLIVTITARFVNDVNGWKSKLSESATLSLIKVGTDVNQLTGALDNSDRHAHITLSTHFEVDKNDLTSFQLLIQKTALFKTEIITFTTDAMIQ